jgi:hypothetical protein
MNPKPYQAKLDYPKPPKPPQQMTATELEAHSSSELHQQERQHRELRTQVGGLVNSLSALKRTVDRVHRIDVWILVASVIGALLIALSLALQL